MPDLVVISGCSGGGKSTLIDALAERGFDVVPEPGRRIVQAEMQSGGSNLPWENPLGFAERALNMAHNDHSQASALAGPVFFDRCAIDAASAHCKTTGADRLTELMGAIRYYGTVFLVPPWPELFKNDAERRHGIDDALEEYERLCQDYPRLGYEVEILPRMPVSKRVELTLSRIGSQGRP